MAILKETDWLKSHAHRILEQHKGNIWTSPITIIELFLLAERAKLDIERLLANVLDIATLKGDLATLQIAAGYIKHKRANVFDALHAAHCGTDSKIISSDKVYDKLGLNRIRLEAA